MEQKTKESCDNCAKKDCENCVKDGGNTFCCQNCCDEYKEKGAEEKVKPAENVCRFC
jgi:hypothetical protein